jgi:hypothetical protein
MGEMGIATITKAVRSDGMMPYGIDIASGKS